MQRKKLLVKIVEHKLEKALADGIRDGQLGWFILFRHNFSTTSQTYLVLLLLVFLIDLWFMIALLVDNIQVVLNNWTLLKAGNCSIAIKKLQSTVPAISTRHIYPIIFVAPIEYPGSTNSTGKNTYGTPL